MLDKKIVNTILNFQKNEITEHAVYKGLAKRTKGKNSEVLKRIANDELRHYNEWKKITGVDAYIDSFSAFKYSLISIIFGLTFAIKIMERGEKRAEEVYSHLVNNLPEAEKILCDEVEHEKLLVEMIDEEKIGYISSMVLGLNDALVELTGALAGFTFALQNSRLIGAAGLITGIAASLSMSASEYLSQKSEKEDRNPLRASFYTGISYVLTVLLLTTPYFVFENYYLSLAVTVLDAVLIIFVFSFFVAVVKELSFKKMFFEILSISLGVAAVSFIIGWITREVINIEI
ncbi:VIT1/CCC1 transporter family protein [Candidatus Bathyarchaeota archaeon]|nr:VIT1/CCC1 transporter family protein [Candidatus Bathyarchaeota archaeon]